MDPLIPHLAAWRGFTAIVVGDFMLDEQIYGDAERLSADAPVPVLLVRRTEENPGGAANVCLDLAALRARVVALGVVGDDHDGRRLRGAMEARGIDCSRMVVDPDRPTTVKRNLIGLAQHRHPQKMFRVDVESRLPIAPAQTQRLLAQYREALRDADVVCIEDYNKGVCTPEVCQAVIAMARTAGKDVFVDPAALESYARYRGCTSITPNRTEAERATRLRTDEETGAAAHNAALARALMQECACDAVVLTLDRHGALLLERDADPVSVPTIAREVYDVTGAGDMFLAALAAARINNIPWPDAVRLANVAAGLEVEVFGVQPIPLAKIHREVLARDREGGGKLRTLDQVVEETRALRHDGRTVVFTNGCFDVLHAGHVAILERARAEGAFVVVGLNSDASVARLKGPSRPVNTARDRARVLGALETVDAVVVFDGDTPIDLIRAIRPDVILKGGDYRKDQIVGAADVESWKGRVVIVPLVPGLSTTRTLAALDG